MPLSNKEVKKRYFAKKLAEAPSGPCACGCGEIIKLIDNYARPRKYISGHNTPKKYDDPTQFKREWNHRNRKARKSYKKIYSRKVKLKLMALFESKCLDCGLKHDGKNGVVFQFHHTDPKTKSFDIGAKFTVYSWDRLVEECKKCVLICANCHKIRHNTIQF